MENIKCPQCGSQIVEQIDQNKYQCPYCGTTFNGFVNQQPNAAPNQYTSSNPDDNPGCWMNGLCFLVPVVGLVLWFTMKSNKPKCAKSYLTWGIVGLVISVIFQIILAAIAE